MCGGHLVPEQHIPSKYVPPRYTGGTSYREHVRTVYFDDPRYEHQKQLAMRRTQEQVQETDANMVRLNQQIQEKNERVAEALTELTGQQFDASPTSWWDWWSNYLNRHPDIAASGVRGEFSAALLNQDVRGLARGALVWTRHGKHPVEEILPGDFVLSQHPRTGELAFRVVLAIRAIPEIEVRKIQLRETTIHASPDHVTWIAGRGWQKVSNLAQGERLHGVSSEPKVENVSEVYGLDGYDIVVDEFSTLFVGEQGVLVHDATSIRPAHMALPGFSAAAVAQAARRIATP